MTTDHPTGGQPADDDDAVVQRVAARQSAMWTRRLGHPVVVPTDLDPHEARHTMVDERDALMIALWALRRDGAFTPDAIDAATTGHGPATIAAMPYAVACAIITRVPDDYRDDVRPALDARLKRFDGTDQGRAHAELAVHGLAHATRTTLGDILTGTVMDTIAEYLVLVAGRP